jgi:glycosyltransferase involved in cell wall biosynthesis
MNHTLKPTAIFFNAIPPDFEQLKSNHPESLTLMGSLVFSYGLLCALLRYCTAERIFLPNAVRPPYGDIRDTQLFKDNLSRITFVSAHNLSELQVAGPLTFVSPMPDLLSLSHLRNISNLTQAPVTGFIHSINSSAQLREMVLLHLSGLNDFDALVCSSTAGHSALCKFMELASEMLQLQGIHERQNNVATPVIPIGIDTDRFSPPRTLIDGGGAPFSKTNFLYIGRISSASKADLIPLLLMFRDSFGCATDAHITIAGDDALQQARGLKECVQFLSLGEMVSIVPDPTQEKKHELLASSDIFLAPSDNIQETFGITLIEAMAAGLPVIASDWNGYKDIIINGETGFLVPTTLPLYGARFDALRGSGRTAESDMLSATTMVNYGEFASKMKLLSENLQLRLTMGSAARRRARQVYDWKAIVPKYESLWGELRTLAACCPRHHVIDFESFHYLKPFSHYSTNVFSMNTPIELARNVTCDGLRLELLDLFGIGFVAHLFDEIINLVNRDGPIRAGDLIERMSRTANVEETVLQMHVYRLMKYGVLTYSRVI